MPWYVPIPIAVFFACTFAQFWFLRRVRDVLIDRHPQTFLKLEKGSFFPHQRLWRFAYGRRYRELGDAELNRYVGYLKRLWIVPPAAWLACILAVATTH